MPKILLPSPLKKENIYFHLQSYLMNIPGWDWRRDDQAVCLNEIKYGMLAQSVLAQGFFTLAGELHYIIIYIHDIDTDDFLSYTYYVLNN